MSTPTPDGENLVTELFHEAQKIADPTEREAFLVRACAGNQSLLQDVRSLLSFADDDDFTEETHDFVGKRIGEYEVQAEIGRGGMGTVYLGRRTEPYKQDVAIKIINAGMLSAEGKRRFGKEMQIMAQLKHPNLARLFTAGKIDNRLPYVVMEYIDGQRIDAYCDNNKLTIRERLELFGKVCSVVSYAHSREVIHRDIKPGNILVTAEGEPKLIDFGIAKVLKSGLDAGTDNTTTLVQQRAFSRDYASPEQVRGDKSIGRGSDIYSLGVVLYELLTGHRAHRFKGKIYGAEEIRRVVCDTEVTRPSVVVEIEGNEPDTDNGRPSITTESVGHARNCQPRQLRRLLKGDLDSILLKALCKAHEDRYQSVQEFSDDISNHLNGRPVKARKGAWWKKFNHVAHKLADNLPPTNLGFRPKLAVYLWLLTIAVIVWQYSTIRELLENRPALNATSIAASLPHSKYAKLQKAIDALSKNVGEGLTQNQSNLIAWEASQMIISTKGNTALDEGRAANFLKAWKNQDCQCYYYNNRAHIAASGWALLAMNKLKDVPTPEQIAFLLNRQNSAGWWPLYYPLSDLERNASTYATAYSILSLYEYLSVGANESKDKEKIRSAIERGQRWLIEKQIDGHASWWDVPYNLAERKKSEGLSGLVLHVLHRTRANPSDLDNLDKLWLEKLPDLSPAVSDNVESTAVLENGIKEDAKNLKMPWAIVATSDAYAGGTELQKEQVLDWTSNIINNIDRTLPEITGKPYFIKAELLISLRYLMDDKVM